MLDSVRAKNTSVHGYDRATTPSIAAFGDRGTVYNHAKAPGVWTLASHTSMFTGYHVDEHLVIQNDHAIESGHSVWERLSDRGYHTGVFSHNPFLTGNTGLEAGFDTVVPTNQFVPYPNAVDPYEYVDDYLQFARTAVLDGSPVRSLLNGIIAKYESKILDGVGGWSARKSPARRCVDSFLEWHNSISDGPWGACLNLMDAHWPYRPLERKWASKETAKLAEELESGSLWRFEGGERPWSEWEAMKDLYDDCIRQADSAIGHMLTKLSERGAIDNTIVIITSDHGEAFGEKSAVRDVRVREHGSGAIHESVLHVPLIIHWPGDISESEVNVPVSLTWLKSAITEVTAGNAAEDPLQFHDGTVLASTHGLDPDESKHEEAAEYVDDMRSFCGHSRATYEAAETGVRKYADWRGRDGSVNSATIHVDNLGDATVETHSDSGRVEAAFRDIKNAEVRAASVQLNEQMESRLADLGYM